MIHTSTSWSRPTPAFRPHPGRDERRFLERHAEHLDLQVQSHKADAERYLASARFDRGVAKALGWTFIVGSAVTVAGHVTGTIPVHPLTVIALACVGWIQRRVSRDAKLDEHAAKSYHWQAQRDGQQLKERQTQLEELSQPRRMVAATTSRSVSLIAETAQNFILGGVRIKKRAQNV